MTTLLINNEQTIFSDSLVTTNRISDGKPLPDGYLLKIRPLNNVFITVDDDKYEVTNYAMCGMLYDTIISHLSMMEGDLLAYLGEHIYHDVGKINIKLILQCQGVPVDKDGNTHIFFIQHSADDGWELKKVHMEPGDYLAFGGGQKDIDDLHYLFPDVSTLKLMAVMLAYDLSYGSGGDIKFISPDNLDNVGVIPIVKGKIGKELVKELKKSFMSRFK